MGYKRQQFIALLLLGLSSLVLASGGRKITLVEEDDSGWIPTRRIRRYCRDNYGNLWRMGRPQTSWSYWCTFMFVTFMLIICVLFCTAAATSDKPRRRGGRRGLVILPLPGSPKARRSPEESRALRQQKLQQIKQRQKGKGRRNRQPDYMVNEDPEMQQFNNKQLDAAIKASLEQPQPMRMPEEALDAWGAPPLPSDDPRNEGPRHRGPPPLRSDDPRNEGNELPMYQTMCLDNERKYRQYHKNSIPGVRRTGVDFYGCA